MVCMTFICKYIYGEVMKKRIETIRVRHRRKMAKIGVCDMGRNGGKMAFGIPCFWRREGGGAARGGEGERERARVAGECLCSPCAADRGSGACLVSTCQAP